VIDVLDAWIDQNLDTWAPSSARDQQRDETSESAVIRTP
jgi:hypothetical protein